MSKLQRKANEPVFERLHFAAEHIDGYSSWLLGKGYSPNTIQEKIRLLAAWPQWIHEQGFNLNSIRDGLTASEPVFLLKRSRSDGQSAKHAI